MDIFSRFMSSNTIQDVLVDLRECAATFCTICCKSGLEKRSFREFIARCDDYRAYFYGCGLPLRSIVLLVQPQSVELMAGFMGAILAGMIPAILAYPNIKFDAARYRESLRGVIKNLEAKILIMGEGVGEVPSVFGMGDGITLYPWNVARTCERIVWHDAAPDEVAFIQHSAGTTGLQKAVAVSHRALLYQIRNYAQSIRLSGDDRIVSWLPLYHDMGLITSFLMPLLTGISVVCQDPGDWVMDPASLLRHVTQFGSTLAWMPNFAFSLLTQRADHRDLPGLDLSSVRAFINCSEPVTARACSEFRDKYSLCESTIMIELFTIAGPLAISGNAELTAEAGTRR